METSRFGAEGEWRPLHSVQAQSPERLEGPGNSRREGVRFVPTGAAVSITHTVAG